MHTTAGETGRRHRGAEEVGEYRARDFAAGLTGPANTTTNYQSSAEPIRKPDYKSKPHSKPRKWRRSDVRRAGERAVERALFGEVL